MCFRINFALKVTEKYFKHQIKEMKKLKTASVADALKEMKIGETCLAPTASHPARS